MSWIQNKNLLHQHAGFSSWALFVHFSSKNELLDTIYLDIKKEYFIAAQKNINFESWVMNILHQWAFQGVKYYVEQPNKFIFMKKFLNSPHLARVTQEVIQKESKAALDLFDAWKRQGCIKDIDNGLIVCLLTNATYGLIESHSLLL